MGGKQWRPLVHVKDVAGAIVLTLEASKENVCGQVFNVGSNEQNYQISELGNLIRDMIPTARVISQPAEDLRNYRVSFDKIHKTLGFEPKYTVQDGIFEIINALAQGKITNYKDPHYNNTVFLEQHDELQRAVMGYKAARMFATTLETEEAAPAVPRIPEKPIPVGRLDLAYAAPQSPAEPVS